MTAKGLVSSDLTGDLLSFRGLWIVALDLP